jgi:DNA adenine methylase
MSLLTRPGAKDWTEYLPLIPYHTRYAEPFFGSGAVYFNKPRAQYNFLNDLDSEVTNAYDMLISHKDELVHYLKMTPYSQDYYKRVLKFEHKNNIERAVMFIVLSNWSFLGKHGTLGVNDCNKKTMTLNKLEDCYKKLVANEAQFTNVCFRKFFKTISIRRERSLKESFAFIDPPYLDTSNTYNTPKWTAQDSSDLFEVSVNSGWLFGICEFDHTYILELAEKFKLKVNVIGERQNLKNRRTEIFITNYEPIKQLF